MKKRMDGEGRKLMRKTRKGRPEKFKRMRSGDGKERG